MNLIMMAKQPAMNLSWTAVGSVVGAKEPGALVFAVGVPTHTKKFIKDMRAWRRDSENTCKLLNPDFTT